MTPRQARRALNDEYNIIMQMSVDDLKDFSPKFPQNIELKEGLLIQEDAE